MIPDGISKREHFHTRLPEDIHEGGDVRSGRKAGKYRSSLFSPPPKEYRWRRKMMVRKIKSAGVCDMQKFEWSFSVQKFERSVSV